MAVAALALGIGLTTVMFSVVYGLILRGLPFENGDRIAMVMEANPSRGEPELALSMHDFAAYRDGQRSFESFGAFMPAVSINISGDDRPERVQAARVTAATLALTHVRPVLGRAFTSLDDAPDGELAVVVSHSLWRDHYASDSAVIGRHIRVNGQSSTIVGVMPDGFAFPNETKLWLPLRLDPALAPWGTGTHVNAVGRLRPGVTMQQAMTELRSIAARLERDHPGENTGIRAVVQPFIRGVLPMRVYSLLYAMLAAVSLVLLIACTNVANLLLAQAIRRRKEVALRAALGASRAALLRQFLAEALVLSLIAAAIGAIVADFGIALVRRALSTQAPFWTDIRLHPQVLLFTACVALVSSIAAGALPALAAARSDITEVLKDQSVKSRSAGRGGALSRSLVIFELVLSSALLVTAALITRSLLNLRTLEPGFESRGVMTGALTLSTRDSTSRRIFFDRLTDGLARVPATTATSVSSNLPGTGWSELRVGVEGKTYPTRRAYPLVGYLAVNPGFFKTFGISALQGRAITSEDRPGTLAVAVVNERFVNEYFPNASPLGQRLNIGPDDSVPSWVTIIGVVPTLYANRPGLDAWPAEVLTAFDQHPQSSATIAIRAMSDPTEMAQPLRALVASIDPDLPVYRLTTMRDALDDATVPVRLFGSLFVVFGIVALTLASIGLYAVLAFAVSRREREIGVRVALGATATDIVHMVLKDGGLQLALGIPVGLVLGIVGARAARAMLFGVEPTDAATIAIVVATLLATGIAACVGPALRASKADPVRCLSAE
jgi:predicted permease